MRRGDGNGEKDGRQAIVMAMKRAVAMALRMAVRMRAMVKAERAVAMATKSAIGRKRAMTSNDYKRRWQQRQ